MATKQYRSNLDLYQPLLLPVRLDEWLPDSHLAYFVADVVTELDLGPITRRIQSKDRRGNRPFDPAQMVALLFYGYATGRFSSRRLALACIEDVPCRVLMGSLTPHFTVIAAFRREYLAELGELFVQIVQICVRAGLIEGRDVVLDGTKVQANASRHSAMSHERMVEVEKRLTDEVDGWLKRAAEADAAEDAVEEERAARKETAQAEVERRISRRERIRAARAALEQEAQEARAAELREREEAHRSAAEEAARAGEEKEAARKSALAEKARAEAETLVPEPPPVPPPAEDLPQHHPEHRADGTPDPKAQRNFTDPESRIMKTAKGAFDQCFNSQAVVDGRIHLIVAHGLSNQAPDSQYLPPLLERTIANLGKAPDSLTADAGYMSETNAITAEERGVTPYLAMARERRSWPPPEPVEGAPPDGADAQARMASRLKTREGQARMRARKSTVELVFGIIKATMGFRQFLLRGLTKARGEWALVCTAYNIRKVYTATLR